MRTLIVSSSQTLRRLIGTYASRYGICDNAATAEIGSAYFHSAIEEDGPYDLVCVEDVEGSAELIEAIRRTEREKGDAFLRARIIAVGEAAPLNGRQSADVRLPHPVTAEKLQEALGPLAPVEL